MLSSLNLFSSLKDTDAMASLGPLLIVGLVFFLIISALGVFLVKMFWRTPKIDDSDGTDKTAILIFLNRHAKLKGFLKRHLVGDDLESNRTYLDEIDKLRAEIERLKKENANIRELHGKAVGHIATLKAEVGRLHTQREADEKVLQAAHQRRIKAQERAEQIERELQGLLKDVESMHRENSQGANLEKVKERLGYIHDPSLDPSQPQAVYVPPAPETLPVSAVVVQSDRSADLVTSQAAEIERLKKLLFVCREEIVRHLNAAKK